MSFCALTSYCVHDTGTTRGQYFALGKAWWSCCVEFKWASE